MFLGNTLLDLVPESQVVLRFILKRYLVTVQKKDSGGKIFIISYPASLYATVKEPQVTIGNRSWYTLSDQVTEDWLTVLGEKDKYRHTMEKELAGRHQETEFYLPLEIVDPEAWKQAILHLPRNSPTLTSWEKHDLIPDYRAAASKVLELRRQGVSGVWVGKLTAMKV